MRLSQAIKKGASLRKQTHRGMLCSHGLSSDVIGAACEAVFGFHEANLILHCGVPWIMKKMLAEFPIVGAEAECPECSSPKVFKRFTRHASVINVMIHLNDDHHWSREKIAGWVNWREKRHAEQIASHRTDS